MADAERFVDRLPANNSYIGGAARVYDAWMPPGTVFADDIVHRETLRRCGGTGLELASGNGRFLIPALEEGLDVHGIDNSPAMLKICQAHANERGLDVVLHEGDMAPLAIDRRFDAIVCPAGSFGLIIDEDTALNALASYFEHLEPGGRLSITLSTAGPDDTTHFGWRLRRTGTDRVSGNTYVVDESVGEDVTPQTMLTYNRVETYNSDAHLIGTEIRKIRVRWWHRDQFVEALRDTGFTDIKLLGDEVGWVALAIRP
jgi:SAM-dependent methyltransferase